MKKRDLMYKYFMHQIDQRQLLVDDYRNKRFLKLDELDCLDIIVVMTELKVLEQTFKDFRIIYKLDIDD